MGACTSAPKQVKGKKPKYKSATHKAVAEMNRKRDAHLRSKREEADTETDRILKSHQERPKDYPRATEVRPGLYLGSLYDALDADFLRTQAITHIVNATRAHVPQDEFRRLEVSVDDDPDADIYPHFVPVCEFIGRALESGNARVLIHCEQGISRSATLATAFIMKLEGKAALEVSRGLKSQRAVVDPNPGFLRALLEWERHLKLGTKATSLSDLMASFAPIARVKSSEKQPVAMWRTKSTRSTNSTEKLQGLWRTLSGLTCA